MKTAEISVQVVEAKCSVTGLTESLCRWLGFADANDCTGDLSERVTTTLFGSRKTRLGSAPSPEMFKAMSDRVARFIASDRPIELVAMWGATKAYGLVPNRVTADVYDVLGIERFVRLASQIREIYSPGLRVNLVREDVGEVAVASVHGDISGLVEQYRSSLCQLVRVLDQTGSVQFVEESSVLAERSVTPGDFLMTGERFGRMFESYWLATQGVADTDHERLPEHRVLQEDAGFHGVLGEESRAYYLSRARNAYPDLSDMERIWKVCVYLGNAIARRRLDFYRGRVEDAKRPIPPLRASFVPYAPGTPSALMVGRVDYKVKDSKSSNNVSPPWCGFGVMEQSDSDFDPRFVGVSHYTAGRINPVTVELVNESERCLVHSDVAA